MKLGDTVATIATPIARVLGLPCIDEGGNLRPESGCAKRKELLNDFGTAVSTWFGYRDRGEKIMKYIVTKQIEVEAESPEEAVAKSKEGSTISLNAQPRPQPAQPAAGAPKVQFQVPAKP